jgi:hypothetical protein
LFHRPIIFIVNLHRLNLINPIKNCNNFVEVTIKIISFDERIRKSTINTSHIVIIA